MSTKTEGKKECKFNVIMNVALEFKSLCALNKVKMNDVITQLMIEYINRQKNTHIK